MFNFRRDGLQVDVTMDVDDDIATAPQQSELVDAFDRSNDEALLPQSDSAPPVVPLSLVVSGHADVEWQPQAHPAEVTKPASATFWEEVESSGGVAVSAARNAYSLSVDVVPDSEVCTATISRYLLLGQYFVSKGIINTVQLEHALLVQEGTYAKLGTILLEQNLVTEDQVTEALHFQSEKRNLGDILRMLDLKVNHVRSALIRVEQRNEPMQQVMRDTRYLSEEKVALALAAQNGLQHFADDRVNRCRFADVIAAGVSLDRYNGFVPIAILDDRTIAVALEDLERKNDAHNYFGRWPNKHYLLASGRTLQKIFCTYFSRTEGQLLTALAKAEEVVTSKQDQTGETEGFMRPLLGLMLRHGCYSGASDIHLSASRDGVATLSMRYDGVLRDVAYFDRELHVRISNVLQMDGLQGSGDAEVMSQVMKEGAITFDKDPRTKADFVDIFGRYGFRLEVGTAANGSLTAVIRIMDNQGATADLDNLGLDPVTRQIVDDAVSDPDGLIMLVGPTGSGKTTTLYACMNEIDPEEHSIQTIENPVEGEHGKWKSYQPLQRGGQAEGKQMGLIFKGVMRNDPDVVLVGEIRDVDVADTAIQASKTGHLVFSTLHVDRAASTVTRLLGLGVTRQDVADTLRLVLAVRLMRRLCTVCAVVDTRQATKQAFEKPLREYLKDVEAPRFLVARDGGCEHCRHTGFRGRKMVYETLRVTKRLRRMIETSATTSEIEQLAIAPGRSMWEVGMRFVAIGISSLDELHRTVRSPMEDDDE